MNSPQKTSKKKTSEIRWAAWLACVCVALLYEALPKVFYWGPRGLMIGLVTLFIIPMMLSHWRQKSDISHLLSLTVNVLITVYMLMSVSRILVAVFAGHIGPNHLLTSSLSLWVSNVLIFALWYWNLDAGGPTQREQKSGVNAFLFPQTQLELYNIPELTKRMTHWSPNFIDYVFLAFNTSTAFSPTDTPVLSRWAKVMSMMQAIISLTIIVMLAARAVNILNPTAGYLVS
jgi:hypothetical protein